MDFKKVGSDFVIALFVAILIYIVGMTFLMVDVQQRLGKIEHSMSHQAKKGGHVWQELK